MRGFHRKTLSKPTDTAKRATFSTSTILCGWVALRLSKLAKDGCWNDVRPYSSATVDPAFVGEKTMLRVTSRINACLPRVVVRTMTKAVRDATHPRMRAGH
jgi:hypothetical protein